MQEVDAAWQKISPSAFILRAFLFHSKNAYRDRRPKMGAVIEHHRSERAVTKGPSVTFGCIRPGAVLTGLKRSPPRPGTDGVETGAVPRKGALWDRCAKAKAAYPLRYAVRNSPCSRPICPFRARGSWRFQPPCMDILPGDTELPLIADGGAAIAGLQGGEGIVWRTGGRACQQRKIHRVCRQAPGISRK